MGLTGATTESKKHELSGGNQQKGLFGRWMVSPPRLFIADDRPEGWTWERRGLYELLVGLASEGMSVLVVSSDLEEVEVETDEDVLVFVIRGRCSVDVDGAPYELSTHDCMDVERAAAHPHRSPRRQPPARLPRRPPVAAPVRSRLGSWSNRGWPRKRGPEWGGLPSTTCQLNRQTSI